jgi:hypothetical protein
MKELFVNIFVEEVLNIPKILLKLRNIAPQLINQILCLMKT